MILKSHPAFRHTLTDKTMTRPHDKYAFSSLEFLCNIDDNTIGGGSQQEGDGGEDWMILGYVASPLRVWPTVKYG